MSDVNLSISQEVVKPIIEAKIKEILCQSLIKKEDLIASAIDSFLKQKVDSEGNLPKYSSDAKYDFLEFHIRKAIEAAVKESVAEWLSGNKEKIKKQFSDVLKSKKGSDSLAIAFIQGVTTSFDNYHFSMSFNYK